jgi:hypothetical protein
MTDEPKCSVETVKEGDEWVVYVVFDGVRIAKRGQPDTPQARTWVSIEPGFKVYDNADMTGMVVEHKGVRVH